MDIKIRQAQPDDVRFVIPLIYSSGPREFDYIFQVGHRTAQDYLSFAFPTRLGSQSYRVCTVATVAQQVVGIGAFYTSRNILGLGLGNLWNVLRFYGPLLMIIVEGRASRMETIIPPPEADSGLIAQLGVKDEFRGHGIGTVLIEHQIGLARKLGLRRCVLDVAMTNPRAQTLYERLGFKVIQENKWKYSDSKIHVPGQRRMELVL